MCRKAHIICPQDNIISRRKHHATQKTPAGADVFVWCIILYSFPHCLPVKNRRVVVARNTLPARSTVVGNSGCEGLQG